MPTGVDELAALAPAQIRSDFTLFDRFEHAVLGARKGRPVDLEKLNSPRLAGQGVRPSRGPKTARASASL